MRLGTLGHSNRTVSDFVGLCRAHGVELVVDVRRYPASKRYPWFDRLALEQALRDEERGYLWLEGLGGMREPRPDSPHRSLTEEGARGYADYLETPEFRQAVEVLLARAGEVPTALMCAEAHPEGCHRLILSDWLVSRRVEVVHLLSPTETLVHQLSPRARLLGERLLYDRGEQASLF